MITAKEMNAFGIPRDPALMPLALRLANTALAQGADPGLMREDLARLCAKPSALRDHPLLGELARALEARLPGGGLFVPRQEPAPWINFGGTELEAGAIAQMESASLLPCAVRGALMPDAHTGYGLPIGGVLAVEGAVIPYAVGVDIACRMRLTVLDMPACALDDARRDALKDALERETRFGLGASFEKGCLREHAVMDEDWEIAREAGVAKDKAWKQLGTSGAGNHFAEFGELHLERPAVLGGQALAQGVYLALLSHSGSRGSGEEVASFYSRRAMALRPALPREMKHLAWLDLDSDPGRQYWACMELMGRYASASHELIHAHVLAALGAEELAHVENHHNFAWLEEHGGQRLVVHRKGATPAGQGVQGVVPGSMASSGFVVQGRGCEDSLASCSHGAGRRMSRAEAFKSLSREKLAELLEGHRVELVSGSLDESPEAYKDIAEVMAGQAGLVDVLARFEPRLVKMAPEQKVRGEGWKRKARKAGKAEKAGKAR
ncbi:MAG: RtcB family protein [Desulfovibrio sp.]|jgi:tRNA-splicing ligase RtcB|nr:RtcB family protein [Desulfovibrio sp.]